MVERCMYGFEDRDEGDKTMTQGLISKKLEQWRNFNLRVSYHIEDYVVPQYGDFPDKMIDEWCQDDIKSQMERYVKRIGSGARGKEEAMRDCFKMAHYACYIFNKLKDQ